MCNLFVKKKKITPRCIILSLRQQPSFFFLLSFFFFFCTSAAYTAACFWKGFEAGLCMPHTLLSRKRKYQRMCTLYTCISACMAVVSNIVILQKKKKKSHAAFHFWKVCFHGAEVIAATSWQGGREHLDSGRLLSS